MIDEEFAALGIEIPFPQRDVHVKLEGEAAPAFPLPKRATRAVASKA